MLLLLFYAVGVSSYPYQQQADMYPESMKRMEEGRFDYMEDMDFGSKLPLNVYGEDQSLESDVLNRMPLSMYSEEEESDPRLEYDSGIPLPLYREENNLPENFKIDYVDEREPLYRDIMGVYPADRSVEADELPWYSENIGYNEESYWPAAAGLSTQQTYQEDEEMNESGTEEDYLKAIKDKKSMEIFDNYKLAKNPVISTRKIAKEQKLHEKKAVIPKKHEKQEKVSEFSPEKRGMPEVPIFRPSTAEDPRLKAKRSSPPRSSRSKRSLKNPTPFVSTQTFAMAKEAVRPLNLKV